jgi:small subunit ribosomal protein S11
MTEEQKTNQEKESQEKSQEITAQTAPASKSAKGKKLKKGKKKKKLRQVTTGRAYIQATYNNTLITFTDQEGNALAASSAGQNGFKGPKKATPYAATVIVQDAINKVAPFGLKEVHVFVKGVGLGRDAAIRALNAKGLSVLSIKDITSIPHNGCRPRKPRRV